jgi:hypothetical protein
LYKICPHDRYDLNCILNHHIHRKYIQTIFLFDTAGNITIAEVDLTIIPLIFISRFLLIEIFRINFNAPISNAQKIIMVFTYFHCNTIRELIIPSYISGIPIGGVNTNEGHFLFYTI